MQEKDFSPEIVNIVDKWNWLVQLSKANCPDKLMKTAIAVAEYIHAVCKPGICVRSTGETCNDYGWAFPDQARDVVEINGNNESSTSKKINELVEQGWLVKVAEKRYGARVKNMFALSHGSTWKTSERPAEQLRGKGGKPKGDKVALTVVEPNKRGLLNLTTADCSTQQAPVVDSNKVNINNKHQPEALTENVNNPAAPGLEVKVIGMNILDPKGKERWGASRRATSRIPSTSLTSEYIFDGLTLKAVRGTISNTAVVEMNKREGFIPFKEAMARRAEILKSRPEQPKPLTEDEAWTW